ncbi:hypothetical protein GUJ93_ZPchr0011g27332 [Zizania palustris]|uniref:Uncharacterized protein n=1 Tax=Zizania palustris TaxID=103762 RepID=A0A8J5WJB2_ZIZPA|nr:hypothetical protein GUJ93_ZPchr0011g27332 [Zizania palustris]
MISHACSIRPSSIWDDARPGNMMLSISGCVTCMSIVVLNLDGESARATACLLCRVNAGGDAWEGSSPCSAPRLHARDVGERHA